MFVDYVKSVYGKQMGISVCASKTRINEVVINDYRANGDYGQIGWNHDSRKYITKKWSSIFSFCMAIAELRVAPTQLTG
jgi:hypothetical protein